MGAWWLVGLAVVALAGLFAPTVLWLAATWRVHPYYTHGPAAVLAAMWLAHRRRCSMRTGRSAAGLGLLAAGLVLQVAATRTGNMPLSAYALLLCIAGSASALFGLSCRALAFPLALVALTVPLPVAEHVTPQLAAAVARGAAATAAAAGVAVQRSGALLAVGDGTLVVGAPCSGLRSLLALGTVAVVLAGVSDAPLGRRGFLVCAALPVALGTNWMRLTSIVVASDTLGTARSVALLDGPAGLVFFLAAVAILLALSRLIGCRVVLAS
jgi:exosortase